MQGHPQCFVFVELQLETFLSDTENWENGRRVLAIDSRVCYSSDIGLTVTSEAGRGGWSTAQGCNVPFDDNGSPFSRKVSVKSDYFECRLDIPSGPVLVSE